MMADPELPPTPPVDVRFTADISQKMTVPHHIRFANGSENQSRHHNPPDEPVFNRMSVPERILVSGGEQHLHEKAPPREIQFDHQVMMAADQLPVLLDTPPRTLRLEQLHFPTVGDDMVNRKAARAKKLTDELFNESATDEDLLQVEINPANLSSQMLSTTDQLTRLKHHVTRLTHRVAILEQENEFRGQRDKLLMFVVVAYVGVKFLLWLKRPNFDFPRR